MKRAKVFFLGACIFVANAAVANLDLKAGRLVQSLFSQFQKASGMTQTFVIRSGAHLLFGPKAKLGEAADIRGSYIYERPGALQINIEKPLKYSLLVKAGKIYELSEYGPRPVYRFFADANETTFHVFSQVVEALAKSGVEASNELERNYKLKSSGDSGVVLTPISKNRTWIKDVAFEVADRGLKNLEFTYSFAGLKSKIEFEAARQIKAFPNLSLSIPAKAKIIREN